MLLLQPQSNIAIIHCVSVVRWRLNEFLEENDLTVYRLHQELQGRVSKTGLYKVTRGETSGVDFELLAHVLGALERLLDKRVEIEDVLLYSRTTNSK